MTARFEQTGIAVCERCGMSAAIAETETRCVTDDDFASDGYPEPVGTHARFVFVERPVAPLILPYGVLMAEREREMAVLAEAIESEQRAVNEQDVECANCGESSLASKAIVVKTSPFSPSEIRCQDCQPNDETDSRVLFDEVAENEAIRRAELIDSGRRLVS